MNSISIREKVLQDNVVDTSTIFNIISFRFIPSKPTHVKIKDILMSMANAYSIKLSPLINCIFPSISFLLDIF